MDKKKPPAQIDADIWLEVRLHETQNDEDSRQRYEHIYKYSDISQRESFYLWLDKLINLKSGEKYLDVSCGLAQLPRLADNRGLYAAGMDLSHEALLQAKNETNCDLLAVGNAQELPYQSNSFDVVSNIGSIEHYTNMPLAIQEMVRILRPGGKAIILVPNTFSLMTNIWTAYRHGRTLIDYSQPIQRYGSRLEWVDMFETKGLQVVKTMKYDIERPRTWSDGYSYLQNPKRILRLLGSQLVPLNLTFHFLFICHKDG